MASGWQVIECIRDAASGYTLDRPGIEQLRGIFRDGGANVVVSYAVDRLSRNQNHIGVLFNEVEQAGARLEFVTEIFEDTAIGRFILSARAFMAEVEREKIAEWTMRGKAERARQGRIPQGTGKGIYGYRYNRETGQREIEEAQAVIVSNIFGWFCSGQGCSRIASELNRDVPAVSGGLWHPLTLRRMLSNETYTGRTVYRRTRAEMIRTIKGARSSAVWFSSLRLSGSMSQGRRHQSFHKRYSPRLRPSSWTLTAASEANRHDFTAYGVAFVALPAAHPWWANPWQKADTFTTDVGVATQATL